MGRKSFTESQDSSNFAAGIADQNYSNLNSSDDENHAADLGPTARCVFSRRPAGPRSLLTSE